MSGRGGWTRRLDKLEKALPDPPAGSPYWHDSLQRLGYAFRLAEREPDYGAAIKAYCEPRPPYGDEAGRLHEHLCELVGRTAEKTPPCSAAEFATLGAWLAENGDALPSAGWQMTIDAGGGVTVTLSDLRWRAGQGPTAGSSGKLADTLRKLRANYPARATGEACRVGAGTQRPMAGRHSSIVREDEDAGPARPHGPKGGVSR